MEFLGVKNVINAEAIIGRDGIADGFKIYYIEKRKIKFGRRELEKEVEKVCIKYIREYRPEIKRRVVEKKSSPKVNLELVSRIIKG